MLIAITADVSRRHVELQISYALLHAEVLRGIEVLALALDAQLSIVAESAGSRTGVDLHDQLRQTHHRSGTAGGKNSEGH